MFPLNHGSNAARQEHGRIPAGLCRLGRQQNRYRAATRLIGRDDFAHVPDRSGASAAALAWRPYDLTGAGFVGRFFGQSKSP